MTEIPFRGALEIAAAIRDKRLSATQYLEYVLNRIEQHDPALNSVITLNADAALAAAHEADQAVTNGDVLGWVTEAVRAGDVPGIQPDARADFRDHLIDRFGPTQHRPYNLIQVRPPTPFG